MDRLADAFSRCRAENRAAFIAYVCAGDPDPETSYALCREMIEAGIDVLELGVPFSDPLADGLTNQLAAQRALEAGATHESLFTLVQRLREISQIPIVLYTYYNLVFSQGVEAYTRRCAEAGVDGILTLDLPPEEAEDLLPACRQVGLKNIFLIAPTTSAERLPVICQAASGFAYYVSRVGVTGVRKSLATDIGEAVERIRQHTDLPVVVGFGLSRPEQVAEIGAMADGVVVGSALVNCIAENLGDPEAIVNALGSKTRELVAGTKLA